MIELETIPFEDVPLGGVCIAQTVDVFAVKKTGDCTPYLKDGHYQLPINGIEIGNPFSSWCIDGIVRVAYTGVILPVRDE